MGEEKFIMEGEMARKPYIGYSFVRTEWEFKKVILSAKINPEKLKGATKLDNFEEFEKWIEQDNLFEDEKEEGIETLKNMFEGASSFSIAKEGTFSIILELNDEIYQSHSKGLKFEMFTTAMKRALERHFGIAVDDELMEKKMEDFDDRKMLRIGYITSFENKDESDK